MRNYLCGTLTNTVPIYASTRTLGGIYVRVNNWSQYSLPKALCEYIYEALCGYMLRNPSQHREHW